MDTLVISLVVVSAVQGVLLWKLILTLSRCGRSLDSVTREINQLRMKDRVRVSTAEFRNGPTTEEHELRKLGRASSGRRVVFGGEKDSELNRRLNRGGGALR